MAENPVIRNFGKATGATGVPTPSASELNDMYNQPAYTGTRSGRYMTLDDVVLRTGAMLATILVVGGAAWAVIPADKAWGIAIGAILVGVALGLYMSFKMVANAPLSLTYAALQGVALGVISKAMEQYYNGIVIQAITGTVMVAAGMLFVYKIGAIRVTPKFTKIVVGATIGVFGLMLVNLVSYLFTSDGLGIRSGGALAIVFSLVCIVIAAANLVMDFDMVERGIRSGADEKYAWYAAFGITVTLVWLYIEILRLLSYLRD